MTNGLELTKLAPRFHEDQVLHVVNTPLSPLVHILTRYGFSVIVIDGLKITDRKGFFEQVKIAFQFPDYFGRNWDAWIDCLRDFEDSLHGNTAVIWDNADHTIGFALEIITQAVSDLYNLALRAGCLADNPGPYQVKILLIGKSEALQTLLTIERG